VVQHAVSASLRHTTGRGWSLGGGVGVLAAGELVLEGRRHTYRPGGLVSVSASKELLDDPQGRMFLTTSWAAALTIAPTRDAFGTRGLYGAVDFSGALALGGTIANVWSPYLSARAFGGPAWFTPAGGLVPGHDPDHHSLGCGSVFSLPKNLEIGVDAALVGAKGLTASAGLNF